MLQLGKHYVNEIEAFLRDNIETVTCKELSEMYFDFTGAITNLGGDIRNLTGLTEFLLYRAFYYANQFKLQSNLYKISRSLPGISRQPDIVVSKENQPVLSIEVKSNYANVNQDVGRHKEAVTAFPLLITATIAFEVQSRADMKKIDSQQRTNHFYQCLILNQTESRLIDELSSRRLIL